MSALWKLVCDSVVIGVSGSVVIGVGGSVSTGAIVIIIVVWCLSL